jgi:hypothetical protein
MNNEKQTVEQYLKDNYSPTIQTIDVEDKNFAYDIIAVDRSMSFTVEYKSRYFTTKNKRFLDANDILIELVQHMPYLQTELDNIDPSRLYIANGWFFKCDADRLVYVRYLDDIVYDVIDIDFKIFKGFFSNYMGDKDIIKSTVYSKKTTGGYNITLKIRDIPRGIINYKKY